MRCLGVTCPTRACHYLCEIWVYMRPARIYPDHVQCIVYLFQYSSVPISCLSQLDLITGWMRMKGRWERTPMWCNRWSNTISYQTLHLSKNRAKILPRVSRYPPATSVQINLNAASRFFQNFRFMPQFTAVKVWCYRSCNNKQIRKFLIE